jgi:hypothetical protein
MNTFDMHFFPHSRLWTSLAFSGLLWTSLDFSGSLWTSLDFSGSLWIALDLHNHIHNSIDQTNCLEGRSKAFTFLDRRNTLAIGSL